MLVNKSMFPIQAGYNAISKMQGSLGNLQTQLGSGEKAATLAEMGSDRSFSLAIRGRLTKLDSYASNMSTVNLRLSFLDQSFTALSKTNSEARNAATPTSFGENNLVMASLQKDSQNRLGLVLEALNVNVGGRYLMGGTKTENPPVAGMDEIMDGIAGFAGYKQVLGERNKADLGPDVTQSLGQLGLPRTNVSGVHGNRLTVSSKELDTLGYSLFSISGNTNNIQTTGPTSDPLNQQAYFSANPAVGDTVTVTLKKTDGTTSTQAMKAVSTLSAPADPHEFLIVANDPAATAENFQTSLESLVPAQNLDLYSTITTATTSLGTTVPATATNLVKVIGETDGTPSLGIKLNGLPNDGEKLSVGVKRPDGTTETLSVTAKTALSTAPAVPGEYLIGATRAETMQNMQDALETQIGGLTATVKLGRLDVSNTPSNTVTITKPAGAYGYQDLTSVSTTGSNIKIVAAAPTPSVAFTGPTKAGETVSFGVKMPDGTTEQIKLQAVEKNPEVGQFVIGTTPEDTAKNFSAALKLQLNETSKTKLVAASTYAAADDFFTTDGQPKRVALLAGQTLETATTVASGVGNTVQWYKGETGTSNPRLSATAQLDDTTKVGYGVRATETGLVELVRTLAAMSVQEYPTSDDTSKGRFSAMVERQRSNLSADNGAQAGSIDIIAMELGVVKSTIGNTKTANTAYAAQMETMLTDVETVSMEETAMKLLALQTRLQASYQTTASISQLSLVNYLK